MNKSNYGFSLIESVIALALFTIIGFSFTSIIVSSNREVKYLEQRADSIFLKSTVEGVLTNLPNCSCLLIAYATTFDSTDLVNANSTISELKSSCVVGASTIIKADAEANGTQLHVDQIKIQDIENLGAADDFRGRLNVSYKKTDKNIRPIRPFFLDIKFKTDPATSDNAKKIIQCDFVSGSATGITQFTGTCPEGQYLRGFLNGAMICSAVQVVVPAGGGEVASNDNASTGKSYSLTNPGPGCRGDFCRTKDYGPCKGDYCKTNGGSCSGDFCQATNGP